MPRQQRLAEPGIYHVVNRGVEQRNIYLEVADYEFFLDLLLTVIEKHSIVVHAFCLMTNHYHLLLETKEHNLSKVMQHLNDKYSKYFNKKYKRVGPLWQGRFKSLPLYDEAHFWMVSKYIERNPIKAGMVAVIDTYKYQSFFQWNNKDEYYRLLNDSTIFNMRLDEYTDYISTDFEMDAIDIVYDSPKVIVKDNKLKVLSKRLETFFELDKDINRDQNIKKAYSYGYTKSEIAKLLELNPSTVLRVVS